MGFIRDIEAIEGYKTLAVDKVEVLEEKTQYPKGVYGYTHRLFYDESKR